VYANCPAANDRNPPNGANRKAFPVVAALVRMYLISLLDVLELLHSTKCEYLKGRGAPAYEGLLRMDL
jgi:hypothetical protein